MNNEHDYPVSARMVRLVFNEQAMVIPAQDSNPPAFEPFYVPHMPMSQTCWLSGLNATFRHRHRRCMAALLMLDCKVGRWLEPLIPTQDCAKNGVTWTLHASDFENQPDYARVAGTFQSGIAGDVDSIVKRIPAHDGLHIFLKIGKRTLTKYSFVRMEGELQIVKPEHVLFDDWGAVLKANRDRFDIPFQE